MEQANSSNQIPFGSTRTSFLEAGAEAIKYYQLPSSTFLLVGLVSVIIVRIFLQIFDGVKAPFAGYRSALEPSFFVRLRFSRGALPMINEGYQKVCVEQRRHRSNTLAR
jgi:Flp pilus assembly pilin Flp